jgi:hypothetical protein
VLSSSISPGSRGLLLEQLLVVSLRLLLVLRKVVVVVVRLTVLHLVLGLLLLLVLRVHLHHAVVLLSLVNHLVFVHVCRIIVVRVHKLLLLLQEHVHRWRR